METKIGPSELILNPDNSIYHLKLKPENIADNIILVGDPGRVVTVSQHFDKIEFQIQNREFATHTGTFNNKRVTAISTGIGTDNIDIVINELDALVNIDLETRLEKRERKSLNFVRIGTSGSLQGDVPVDSFAISQYGLGLDGMLNYYAGLSSINENELSEAFIKHTHWDEHLAYPYIIKGSETLFDLLSENCHKGITATAPGFFGPQGRQLRLVPAIPDLNEKLTAFNHNSLRINNFEMETSALYGLSKLMGHHACTLCAIIANRIKQEYSKDYHPVVNNLILHVLKKLTA